MNSLTRIGCSVATVTGLFATALLLAPLPAVGQEPETITEEGVIAGTMEIDFKTRTTPDRSGTLAEKSAALGAKDTYKFSLSVAKTTEFSGTITRQPNLYSKLVRSVKQGAALGY